MNTNERKVVDLASKILHLVDVSLEEAVSVKVTAGNPPVIEVEVLEDRSARTTKTVVREVK